MRDAPNDPSCATAASTGSRLTPSELYGIRAQEITEDNIERPRANSTLDLAEKSESEHEFSDTAAGDVEKGVSSSTTGKENPTSEQVVNDAGNATAEDTADHSDLDVVKTATLNENTEQTSSSEIDPEKGHTFVPIAKKDEPAKYDNIDSNPTGETDPAATTEDANVDEISDDGSSVGAMVEFIGIGGEEDGMISVPSAGECRHDVLPEGVSGSFRKEPNGCAVCLCPFEPLDKITWSSNPSCQHVFHDTCIKDWLMASGRKHLKRQRREQRRTGNLSYESDPVGKITGFPKLCPCCRQHFIVEEEEESVDEKETRDIGDTENVDAAEMGNDEAMRIAAS